MSHPYTIRWIFLTVIASRPISSTMSCPKNATVAGEDASLDLLFAKLAQNVKRRQEDNEPKPSTSIKSDLASFPKIQTKLFDDNLQNNPLATSNVVRVNDPIVHIRKPAVDKDADAGSRWFNMKKPEMTAELKRDLMVLKNRSVLDRKRHYKKEKWQLPQFFQTGTIVEGNTEFYSARMTKKNRGRTLAEEILNDTDSGEYFKKKYSEIQKKKTSGGKKHYKKLKLKRQGY